jgi:hypothetical protein
VIRLTDFIVLRQQRVPEPQCTRPAMPLLSDRPGWSMQEEARDAAQRTQWAVGRRIVRQV